MDSIGDAARGTSQDPQEHSAVAETVRKRDPNGRSGRGVARRGDGKLEGQHREISRAVAAAEEVRNAEAFSYPRDSRFLPDRRGFTLGFTPNAGGERPIIDRGRNRSAGN